MLVKQTFLCNYYITVLHYNPCLLPGYEAGCEDKPEVMKGQDTQSHGSAVGEPCQETQLGAQQAPTQGTEGLSALCWHSVKAEKCENSDNLILRTRKYLRPHL